MPKFMCLTYGSESSVPIHCGDYMKPQPSGSNIEFLLCDMCGFESAPPKHHDRVMRYEE